MRVGKKKRENSKRKRKRKEGMPLFSYSYPALEAHRQRGEGKQGERGKILEKRGKGEASYQFKLLLIHFRLLREREDNQGGKKSFPHPHLLTRLHMVEGMGEVGGNEPPLIRLTP